MVGNEDCDIQLMEFYVRYNTIFPGEYNRLVPLATYSTNNLDEYVSSNPNYSIDNLTMDVPPVLPSLFLRLREEAVVT